MRITLGEREMLATLAPPLGLGGRGGAAVRFVEDDNDKDGDEGAFIVCPTTQCGGGRVE